MNVIKTYKQVYKQVISQDCIIVLMVFFTILHVKKKEFVHINWHTQALIWKKVPYMIETKYYTYQMKVLVN